MNGSRVNGGCEANTMMRLCGTGKISFLTDGIIPVLHTTDPNWASELVTVRKNNSTAAIPYDHVVLTFVFQKPQLLNSVKLNLFKCPQWGIGAPNITVYGEAIQRIFFFDRSCHSIIPLSQSQDVQSSCDSLVPVTIPLQTGKQYQMLYIVVSFEPQPAIDWVHVGEVEFFGIPTTPPSTSTEPTPSKSLYIPYVLNYEYSIILNNNLILFMPLSSAKGIIVMFHLLSNFSFTTYPYCRKPPLSGHGTEFHCILQLTHIYRYLEINQLTTLMHEYI